MTCIKARSWQDHGKILHKILSRSCWDLVKIVNLGCVRSYRPNYIHVFSNCKVALEQGRYTWRHDSILITIIHHFKAIVNEDLRLFADCPNSGTVCTSTLFQTSRPNLVVVFKDAIYVIELTVPYETNCKKAKRRKEERYKNLRSELIMTCSTFEVITLEDTTLGFVSNDINRFRRLLRTLDLNEERIVKTCMEVALRATFIFIVEGINPGIIQTC